MKRRAGFFKGPTTCRKIGEARADAKDHIRLGGKIVRRARAGNADSAHRQVMIDWHGGLAGLRPPTGIPRRATKIEEIVLGLGIENPAAVPRNP